MEQTREPERYEEQREVNDDTNKNLSDPTTLTFDNDDFSHEPASLLNRILPCRPSEKEIQKRILPLPWPIVISISLPFFMNVLDTSVFSLSNWWLKLYWFLESWKMLILLRVQAVHMVKRITSRGNKKGLGSTKASRLLLCLAKSWALIN